MSSKTLEYFKILNKRLKKDRNERDKVIESQGTLICRLNATIQEQRDKIEELEGMLKFHELI